MRTCSYLLIGALVLSSGCRGGSNLQQKAGPRAGVEGFADDGSLQLSEKDRCPVCAMTPKKHSKFACGMELADGRTFYFCGTGCMIRTWLHPEVYIGDGAVAERMYVKDYFGGQPIDAMEAFWVAGSDVVGPMGPAIVPLATEEDADTFVQRHGSKKRFRLDEMDDATWKKMTGKDAAGAGNR